MSKTRITLLALTALVLAIIAALFFPLAEVKPSQASDRSSPFDPALQQKLAAYVDARDTIDSLVIASAGRVLYEHGPTHLIINTHSVRKSIMSVLIGMAVKADTLSASASLESLGVDDAQMPLTDIEKRATVADLLKARSGIYIEAAGETADMKSARPQRGQYAPGEHYYYNNWDFNTLGTVLSRSTGRSLESWLTQLATELAFEDYLPQHLRFSNAQGSEHDQYVIFISARDLAKVGQMMIRGGRNKAGKALITQAWINESTRSYSSLEGREPLDGYGYLWSTDHDTNTYWATGWGGQYMLVDPQNDLVIVTRNDTGRRLGEFLWLVALGNSGQGRMADVAEIHKLLLASRAAPQKSR